MRKMKKEGIKLFIVALASFLMLVCIVAASPDSTLQFIDPTPANYTQEQDFTLGVLAINTHKSCYLPNEAAFIGIAVLDNEGHMICDADVTLTITDPSNNETVLSTSNGFINVSPQCCVYGVTNLPDFYTNYTVDGAGTYVMNLTVTAVTANGTKSITDVFSVQNSVDFEVARDGATRIYPPMPYVMNFTIKANKNYTGLIREYVPASFVITPQDGLTVTTVGDTDTKILTWNKNLVEGETYNIYYEFDAPDVSPYLFTLGALEIGSFKEDRQWQIASDVTATVTYYFDAYSTGEAWEHKPEDMVDNILTNYAGCKVNLGTEGLTGNTCPGTDFGTISKVEIRAYGYLAAVGDSVSLRPVFTAGDGTDHTAITATTPGWGSYIDITTDNNAPSPWTWSDVSSLDCDVVCHHDGNKFAYCAKVEIRVTYDTPTPPPGVYYFDAYSAAEAWVHKPEDMVDNILTNHARCSVNLGTELLTGNTCPGTDLGTISKVEIRAYGYLAAAGDSVSLRPVFTAGDGTDHTAITATTPGWGSYIDITTDTNAPSAWIWSDVSSLECDVVCHHSGTRFAYCAKVEIRVTYYAPTSWESYNCPGHTPECQDDTFSGDEHTVYMHGTDFLTSHPYRVAYYDAEPDAAKIYTNDVNSDGAGTLSSNCVFTSFPASDPGTWHAIVCERTKTPPSTYDSGWAYIIADDSFTVEESAIPEFPTVITGFAVCMLCAVAYVVMRRRAEKG